MKLNHPLENLVKTINCNGITYDIVERPDVLWVGCLDYAQDNDSESDSDATLVRFRKLLGVEKKELINPSWSASLWINYDTKEKPCGQMFAQETYSDKQDKRYELLTQPAGLWIRVQRSKETSLALFGNESIDAWDYFACGELQKVAEENGFYVNSDIHMQIGYDCHAEYSTPPHTCYAYLPVCKKTKE